MSLTNKSQTSSHGPHHRVGSSDNLVRLSTEDNEAAASSYETDKSINSVFTDFEHQDDNDGFDNDEEDDRLQGVCEEDTALFGMDEDYNFNSFPQGPLFLNEHLRVSTESATLLINEQSRLMEANGETVYKFGFGQSPFLPPRHVMDELAAHAHKKEYLAVQGLQELREKIATFHNHYDELSILSRNVLIAPGSKMLIYAILAAFTTANVFIVTPSWVSYEPQAVLANLDVIRIQTRYEENWRLTPALLLEAYKARKGDPKKPSIIIFNYPGNPCGLTYSDEELIDMAATFRKLNMLVVSDEIYGFLNHTGEHKSIARFYPEGTIVTSGMSKWCGAGGWRLGCALMPRSLEGTLKSAIIGILSETVSGTPTPVQYAALKAYEANEEMEMYLQHQRRILALVGGKVHEILTEVGIRVVNPTGGFYMYPDLTHFTESLHRHGIKTSTDLTMDIFKKKNVALLPGQAFGAPGHIMTFRLAYVDFDGLNAMKASEAVSLDAALDESFLEAYCNKCLQGAKQLADYVAEL